MPQIINITSQAGGTGKTNAALYVARTFKEAGGVAVILDLNFSGPHLAETSLNIDYHACKKPDGALLNIYEMFSRVYMSGLGIPDLNLDAGKINIIGSSVDGLEYNPAVIFDYIHEPIWDNFFRDIHSYVQHFSFVKGHDYNYAIILDHNSGYNCLVPTTENWLLDMGPTIGSHIVMKDKYGQHLKAMDRIKREYQSRWETATCFKTQNVKDIPNETFFYRLLEEAKNKNSELLFYIRPDSQYVNPEDFILEGNWKN
jgi:hypothetical protein